MIWVDVETYCETPISYGTAKYAEKAELTKLEEEAIFHAADDRSVVESLAGLGEVFASARALAGDRDYHLGLVSIGLRSNPHGLGVAPNPRQVRLATAGIDPRQRGLFGAAWAVGAIAATQGHRVCSAALAAPVGPLGIVHRPAAWPQPLYDDLAGDAVYPLFHVVRALAQMTDAPRRAAAETRASLRYTRTGQPSC